jgi:hypothetical protein
MGEDRPSEEEFHRELRRQVQSEVVTDESLKDEVPPLQYATNDADIIETVVHDQELAPLFPLYSQLNRLGNVDSKEKTLWKLDIDILMGMQEIFMDETEYNSGKWSKIQAHATYLKLLINDSHKGFKMQLLSRVRKEIAIEGGEQRKKKGFLGLG